MNTEALIQLETALRSGLFAESAGRARLEFDMSKGFAEGHACATACCLAGLTCLVLDRENVEVNEDGGWEWHGAGTSAPWGWVLAAAVKKLNLTYVQAYALFEPFRSNPNLEWTRNASRETAAEVLKHFRETGTVDWNRAKEVVGHE